MMDYPDGFVWIIGATFVLSDNLPDEIFGSLKQTPAPIFDENGEDAGYWLQLTDKQADWINMFIFGNFL